MKRMIQFGVAISILALLSGCGDSGNTPKTSEQDGSIQQSETMSPASDEAVIGEENTSEPPASNYLRPELIEDLVELVDGTIVECNTAYGGSRAETAMHYQVAEDHGFTAIADFQILDEDGSMSLPVEAGRANA